MRRQGNGSNDINIQLGGTEVKIIMKKLLSNKNILLMSAIMIIGIVGLNTATYYKVQSLLKEATEGAYQQNNGFGVYLFLLSILILIIFHVVFLIIFHGNANTDKQLTLALKEIAAGNYETEVQFTGNRELIEQGDYLNQIRQKITGFIGSVKEAVEIIAVASSEMKQSSSEMSTLSERVTLTIGQLAEGAGQQAESTESGSVRINNIVDTIVCIAQDMTTSEKLAESAIDSMQSVKGSIQYQEQKMEENKHISEKVGEAVLDLMNKSTEIGSILQVMQGVSEQTNLLALNAAIEAARAGEQGKGFAVVSQEIRKLADQSGRSSKQITDIIEDVQRSVENTVKQIEKANLLSVEQEKALNQTVQAINDISDKVESIATKVKAVSTATESLTEDAKEAEDMIATIASISEETAAGTEESSASVEEQNMYIQVIAECSNELYSIAGNLKGDVEKYSSRN